MNERDSENIAANFVERGWSITNNEDEADAIIVNTCSVREQAENKAIGKLGHLINYRNFTGKNLPVIGVTGCMAQNRGGLSIFFDYFRTSGELASFPGGTARTYKSHACGSDIFEGAGSRDITYSPCSDAFLDAAYECGAKRAECMAQEEFFMRYAQGEIRRIVEIPDPLDRKKRELCQLLSPDMMGRVFRVIAIY